MASAFVAAALVASCGGQGGPEGAPQGSRVDARVVRVVDGDTIVADVGGSRQRVRYIGVDTPESVKPNTPVQCFAKRASALNRQMVEGRTVTLSFDRERTDRYGRLLAYVQRSDGLDVNAQLLKLGAARTLEISPNTSRASAFRALAAKARKERRGMWGMCGASQAPGTSLVLSTG